MVAPAPSSVLTPSRSQPVAARAACPDAAQNFGLRRLFEADAFSIGETVAEQVLPADAAIGYASRNAAVRQIMSITEDGQAHWNGVYAARAEDELTWFEAKPSLSLELVKGHLRPGETFIDVGAGASRLVDTLLDEGLGPLAVLDISASALAVIKGRLGPRAEDVAWIKADVTDWEPDRTYAVWYDRAVFHFLTAPEDRAAYARVMSDALRPGGTAIIATFADDGPETCSGLPVARCSPDDLDHELRRLLPGQLKMIEAKLHMHITPKGNRQSFQYSVFRKLAHIE